MRTLIYIFLYTAVIWSCKQEVSVTEPAAVENAVSDGTIHLSSNQLTTAGIATGVPEQKPAQASMAVTGEMHLHNEYRGVVSALADGTVSWLNTGINKPVTKGEVIARYKSPALMDLQQQYFELKERIPFLESEWQRYQTLAAGDATANKNLLKAQAEFKEAQARWKSIQSKLQLFHIRPSELAKGTPVTEFPLIAPVSGIITKTLITQGAYLMAGAAVCEIASFGDLHADLFLFEKDLSKVRVGQKVKFQTVGDTTQWTAQIFSIDKIMDQDKKALRAHAHILTGNSGARFSDGAFLNARIALDQASVTAWWLPVSAVVQESDHALVFVKVEGKAGQFKPLKVSATPVGNTHFLVQPLDAVDLQQEVVLKGAYYLAAQAAGVSAEE